MIWASTAAAQAGGALKPGRALAMMRREISVADFALFCADTQRCRVSRWTRKSAPVDEVSAALIRDYAAWLSSASGRTYRLPRDASGCARRVPARTAAQRRYLIAGGCSTWLAASPSGSRRARA